MTLSLILIASCSWEHQCIQCIHCLAFLLQLACARVCVCVVCVWVMCVYVVCWCVCTCVYHAVSSDFFSVSFPSLVRFLLFPSWGCQIITRICRILFQALVRLEGRFWCSWTPTVSAVSGGSNPCCKLFCKTEKRLLITFSMSFSKALLESCLAKMSPDGVCRTRHKH